MLQDIKEKAEELGYSTKLVVQAIDVRYDTLSILWDDKDDEEQRVDVIIYPSDAELEGSVFIQFYAEYSFGISDKNLLSIVSALPTANNRLPLGHFDISADSTALYFRYVLALPVGCGVSAAFLNDVLNMCIYAYEEHLDRFRAL